MRSLVFILLVSSILTATDSQSDRARAKYLDKKVIVTNPMFHKAVYRNGGFEASYEYLPDRYVGKEATVVSVTTTDVIERKVNAFGEPIEPTAPLHFNLVVRFADGYTAIIRDTLDALASEVKLPEELPKEAEKQRQYESMTAQLVGRKVYAIADSTIYDSDTTLAEIMQHTAFGHMLISVPYLEPLEIVAAKWDSDANCAITKLKIGDKVALALLSPDPDGLCIYGGAFLFAVPDGLTREERDAIRRHSAIRGMSESALYFAVGLPDRVNDYGRGGYQLVYPGGLIVYLDEHRKVNDVQHIARF